MIFEYHSDFDQNGTLYFLATSGRRQAWRNPAGSSQVTVLKSGVGFGNADDLLGKTAVNLRTANIELSYFGVDLTNGADGVDRGLVLSGYCLRNRASSSHSLITWVLQATNNDPQDESAWVTLDNQTNCPVLKGKPGVTGFFPVDSSGGPVGYRAFRVLQTGKNSSGSFNLGLSGIELYGTAVRGVWP